MRTALRAYWDNVATAFVTPRTVKVVALGHQKSGTTAVAGLIAKAAGVAFANDPLYEIDKGRAHAVEGLFNEPGTLGSLVQTHKRLFCRPVLKDPDLSFVADEAVTLFSDARFIFVMRDPRTTIRSIADRLSLTAADLAAPASTLVLPNRHWGLILSGVLPKLQGTSVAEVLARRWVISAEAYEKHSPKLIMVSYEEFLKDKVGVIHRSMDAMQLPVKRDVSAEVGVAFQPKGNASTPLLKRLGKESLFRINEICGPKMGDHGYS